MKSPVIAGPHSADLTNVVLVGFSLLDPHSASALQPVGLLHTPTAKENSSKLHLVDVRILVDINTLRQHAEFFGKHPSVAVHTVSA